MLYEYQSSFFRDVKKASTEAQIDLNSIIAEIKLTDQLSQIKNLKKLKEQFRLTGSNVVITACVFILITKPSF